MYPQQQMNYGVMPGVTMMQPAMGNLPVPATQYVQQPTAPNISNPIFANAISNDQVINQYSQQILWALANELTNNAVRINSPLRVFAYNLYSNNGFNNQEFFAVGQLVGQRVKLAILRQEYPNIETAIGVLVPDTVTVVTGANVRRFDSLIQFCNPAQVNDSLGAAQRLDRIQAEIATIGQTSGAQLQGHMTGQAQQIGTGVMQPGVVQGGNAFSQIGNTVQAQLSASAGMPQPSKPIEQMSALERQAYEAEVDAAKAVNQRMTQVGMQYQPNPQIPASRPSNLAGQYNSNPVFMAGEPAVVQEAPVVQAAPTAPENCTVLHVGANAPAYVAPSAEEHAKQVQAAAEYHAQMYTDPAVLARNVFTRADLITSPDDIQKAQVLKKELQGEITYVINLNGKEHKIESPAEFGEAVWTPSALQPFHPLVSLAHQKLFYLKLSTGETIAIVQELPNGKYHMDYDAHAVYNKLNSTPPATPAGKPLAPPQFKEIDVPQMSIVTSALAYYFSVESAINESYMNATGVFDNAGDEKVLGSMYEARVYTPIVFQDQATAASIHDLLTSISASPNFAVAAATIEDISEPRVRKMVDRFITNRINDVLKFELSTADNVIDSFMNDHAELLQVIATNYAGAIAETISSHQGRIIRSSCTVVKHDKIADISDYFAENADKAKVSLERTLFITRGVTVAVCNMRSDELAPFFAEEACAVLETTMPHLRELIARSVTPKHLSGKLTTAHYVVTLDGYRYQASNSMTAPGTYLLRRV